MKLLRKLFPKKAQPPQVKVSVTEHVWSSADNDPSYADASISIAQMMLAQVMDRDDEIDTWENASLHDRTLFLSYAIDLMNGNVVRFHR